VEIKSLGNLKFEVNTIIPIHCPEKYWELILAGDEMCFDKHVSI
jgi:hypothetical protein